jgi:hypothetical protein
LAGHFRHDRGDHTVLGDAGAEMNAPNLGLIYNTYGDDSTAKVSLSAFAGTDYALVSSDIGYQNVQYGHPTMFMIDNSGEREFALLTRPSAGVINILIYSVIESPLSFSLVANEVATPTDALNYVYFLGVKKVSASIYNIYYRYWWLVAGVPTIRIKKIAVEIGVGKTESQLFEYTIPIGANDLIAEGDLKVVNRKAHFTFIRQFYGGFTYYLETQVYYYCFNMYAETCSGGLYWESAAGERQAQNLFCGEIYFSMDQVYIVSIYRGWTLLPTTYYYHCVINQVDTILLTSADTWNVELDGTGRNTYNDQNFLRRIRFECGAAHYAITVTEGGYVFEGNPASDHIIYNSKGGGFRSDTTFPCVVFNRDDDKHYWADPSTGEALAEFTVAGADMVYLVYPILDTFTNYIYAQIRVGTLTKIVGLDPVSLAIEVVVLSYSPAAKTNLYWWDTANIGNFFVDYYFAFANVFLPTLIFYIGNFTGVFWPAENSAQMVIELN